MPTLSGTTWNFDSTVRIGGATVRAIDLTDGSIAGTVVSDDASGEYSMTVVAGRYGVLAFKGTHHKTGITGPIDVA